MRDADSLQLESSLGGAAEGRASLCNDLHQGDQKRFLPTSQQQQNYERQRTNGDDDSDEDEGKYS